MEAAIEYDPAVFGRVVMLYVPITVNGVPMQAFVDSGAQSTIMSARCAERCGILRLIDRRFAGIAKGVGTSKILGRVHSVPVQLGNCHITSSFTILENQDMDFLWGLDQLKKHQACIDLNENVLRIHGEAIPFLAEKDLPIHLRAENHGEEMISPPPPSSSSSSSSSSSVSSSASRPRGIPPTSSLLQPRAPVPSAAAGSAVPSASSAVASAAGRPAGSLSASIPPPAASPSPAPSRTVPAAQPIPSSSPSSASSLRPQSVPSSLPLSESSIDSLVQLGFTREESITALNRFQGNVDAAASFLFNTQMGF